ncbi:phosphoribosyltransferase family protein [Sphingomonas sp. DG1-23]|uniref:phosphoribosyltransferase n=1 Tax=Sphingomonas sp. DG1-23 TaxID=3068316 RepID=UPI00273DFE01|nr:phosphoribosyltransferase family protein [Sphingomonas sp. DG1-23]MDP5278146.1 phosphoribosyltransferase family protein [Sphingomonas sp. DG1-23]
MSAIVFSPYSHDDMVAGIEALAGAMETEGWRPALLVGIGRGGLVPGVYLSHRMDLQLVSIDHSAGIASFGAALVAVLAERTRAGDQLLFVEDINDSGRTIGDIRAALAAQGAVAANIRFAVLIDNKVSAQQVDYRHRVIDRSVNKDWFIFPWEAMAPREKLAEEAMEVPERIA